MQPITPLRDFTSLCNAMYIHSAGREPVHIMAELQDRRTLGHLLNRLYHQYNRSRDAAEKFGFVGVGCISFADARLVQFQERLLRRARR